MINFAKPIVWVDDDIETTHGRLLHPVVVPHDNIHFLFVLTIIVIFMLTSMLTTTDLSTTWVVQVLQWSRNWQYKCRSRMKWELTIQVPKKNEVGIDNTSAEEEWSGDWQYKCRRRMKWELTIQVPKQCRCKHNDLTFTNLVNLNSNNTWTNLIVDLTLLSNNGHSIL